MAASRDAPADLLSTTSLRGLSKAERGALFGEYVVTVRRLLAEKQAASARDLAERATRLFPESRRGWLHLAAARLQLAQWGPAIEAARRAARAGDDGFAPDSTPEETAAAAAYWEGRALYHTQRYDEALPRLRAAWTAAPHWPEAGRALGEATFVVGDMPGAAAAYGAAFAAAPELGTTRDLSYWAEAQAATGDLGGGIATMQAALRREPYAPGLHAKLGDLLRRDGELADGYYELLTELLLHGVESPFAKPALVGSNAIVKQAYEDSTQAAHLELLFVTSGLQKLNAGKARAAAADLHRAQHRTRSASPVLGLQLADALLQAGDAARAETELQRVLAVHADFVPALYTLAEAQAALGKTGDAEATRARMRAIFPGYWKLAASAAESR